MYKENINVEILNLANEIKLFPNEDKRHVAMYLENNELGVAFDTLCNQLFENDIKITLNSYKKIEEIGEALEISNSSWIFLMGLVDELSIKTME